MESEEVLEKIAEESGWVSAYAMFERLTPAELCEIFKSKLQILKGGWCKEQREKCAQRAWIIQYEFDPREHEVEYDEFIRDAPEPE